MKKEIIKDTSNWLAVDAALVEIRQGRWAEIPDGVFASIADRLRIAIESPDSDRVLLAARVLERFYREAVAAAPETAQKATRAESNDPSLDAAYALGKSAFAHLLAARVADMRADERFVAAINSRRYLPYIQALYGGSLSVASVRERVGHRLETVSRALAGLRALGIVVSRKEGTTVINSLSPAARDLVKHLELAVSARSDLKPQSEAAQEILEQKRDALPEQLKAPPRFAGLNRKAA